MIVNCIIVVAHARVNLEDYPGGKSTKWHRLGLAIWRSLYAASLRLVDASHAPHNQ
jgi:hypothetical protein